MAPKVTEEYLEERRQQILDAAVICFSRIGFHKSTMENIREESGLSIGAIYRYFKTKDEIIDALRARSSMEDDSFLSGTEEPDDPLKSLKGIMERTFDRMMNPKSHHANRLALFIWAEATMNPRIWEGNMSSIDNYRNSIEKIIEDAQVRGYVKSDLNPFAVAMLVGAILSGFQIQFTWEPDLIKKCGNEVGEVIEALLRGDLFKDTLKNIE